ncbi:MAG: hypothetical protein JXA99_17335 [Candidatus Lokiarchaeota archaeon]|nr:hypothetical protein [Candidatus Lokiarchaeota archaeon]
MSNDKIESKSTISFQDLQSKLNEARKKRDELNQKTKIYISSLQEIESVINDLINNTKERYRKKRDYWNKKVAELKEKKIEYKEMLKQIINEKRELQKDRKKNKGSFLSVKKIDSKIENLERMIETENLDIAEENNIIDQITDLMKKKQELLGEENNNEYFMKEKKIKIIKINLNKIYEQLDKWSNKSQDYHNKMLEIYEEVKENKNKKKKIEEELIENKKQADKYHEQYLELVKEGKKLPRNKNYRSKKPKSNVQRLISHNNINNKKLEKIKQDKLATALEKQKAGKRLNIYEARLIFEKNKGP